MRMSAAFPSAYLKAADLNNRRIKIAMDRVEMEDIGGDLKPVLYFLNTDKKMVVNKTNANEIIEEYGDDTEAWHGKVIELYEARVDFQGKKVMAIRVNAMLSRPTPQQATAAQSPLARPPVNGSTSVHAPNGLGSAIVGMDEATPSPSAAKDPFDVDEIPF